MRQRVAIATASEALVEHANEPALAARLEATLERMGLRVVSSLSPSVALIVRTRSAAEIAAVLGDRAPSAALVVLEHELDQLTIAAPPTVELPSLGASPTTEAIAQALAEWPFAALSSLATRVAEQEPSVRGQVASALLLDPRISDASTRSALLSEVERAPPSLAVATLTAVLTAHRSAASERIREAVALGRLVAQGARRWDHGWCFAIELDDPRDEITPQLRALFRANARYERLCDERGATVHRARYDSIPWLDDDDTRSLPPALALLRALDGSDAARVWFAATALPASLPWSVWSALLGQRARR